MAPYYNPGFGFSFEFPFSELPADLKSGERIDPAALSQGVKVAVERSFGALVSADPLTSWKSVSITGIPYEAAGGCYESGFGAIPAAIGKALRKRTGSKLPAHLAERSLLMTYWTERDEDPASTRGIALYLRVDVRVRRNAHAPEILITDYRDLDILTRDFLDELLN